MNTWGDPLPISDEDWRKLNRVLLLIKPPAYEPSIAFDKSSPPRGRPREFGHFEVAQYDTDEAAFVSSSRDWVFEFDDIAGWWPLPDA